MIYKNEVAATTQKKPQSQATFLCRDWHNGVVKVCVVEGEQNARKMGEVLNAINNAFHYKFEGCDGEYAEFERDLMLRDLFETMELIPHKLVETGCCDVWNPQGLSYVDAYWGF